MIREETVADRAAVHALNKAAFQTTAEAVLVDELRRHTTPFISLVYEKAGKVVGHIAFSPVTITGVETELIMGLAPIAVEPGSQGQGIGSALIEAGLRRCRSIAARAVVVLGHTDLYPRFGFRPAAQFGLTCEFDVPEAAFMALALQENFLDSVSGEVRYHEAFRKV